MQCNIEARGKAIRLIGGAIVLCTAVVVAALTFFSVLASDWWWMVVGVLAAIGGVGIFEARAGWCVVRAMGIRTRW